MRKKMALALLLIICVFVVAAISAFLLQQSSLHNPGIPTEFSATEISTTWIDLTWVKGKNADTTYIERNSISPWQIGDGIEIYNGTGEQYRDILPQKTQYFYQAWSWNQTDHTYSGSFAKTNTSVLPNQPPIFASPTPANHSVNTPLNFPWSIAISDPEEDPIAWTIQCSNGQTTGGTGASNGIKTLILSGLANSTSYTVWVNATDPTGSGLYTRKWYTFSTKTNQTHKNTPPILGNPSPANGSTGNLLSLIWSIPINDPEGDAFTWTIQCSNKQITGGIGVVNGTKSLNLSGLTGLTTYKIWVNVTDLNDSSVYTRKWYTFTTKIHNAPPTYGSPSPANESTGNPLNLTWSIPINDPEGNNFSWVIQCSNQQINSGTGASNGTKTLVISGLAYLTSYKIWVNATDATGSGLFTKKWYVFTTRANQTNNTPPIFGTPFPPNESTGNLLDISWSIPINDPEGNTFTWSIQCSNGQITNGTGASNGTKTLIISGLVHSTTYKVWVNATDPFGSGIYTRRWFTFITKSNLPPIFGAPTPMNRSTNLPLNITWSIPITDPEGDLFSLMIRCSNGQSNGSINSTNGTKSLTLTNLTYSRIYTVTVNATDTTGSGLTTSHWFIFSTVNTNRPPLFGKPSPANHSPNNPLNLTWSILIQDPEGNPFSWSLQCDNGQTINGTSTMNGTKSLSLANLVHSVTYKIWVNATDPTGSGLYTRAWYVFTTITNQPPAPPTITGLPKGKVRVAQEYNFTTTDFNGDEVYYFIDWGDGTNESWIGPYQSGTVISLPHTWSKKGTYTIKAKAKDVYGSESDWGTLDITMPFSFDRPFQPFWERFFDRFPHIFPILRYVLEN